MSSIITKPTLLLDKAKCLRNIETMIAKAQRHGLTLRPHCKTHQSHEVGRWFRERGINKITVSSLDMAHYFAADDWRDITIAFPVNILEIASINRLAVQVKLNVLVESEQTLQALARQLEAPVHVFLKIDIGYHRTGITPDRTSYIDRLLAIVEAAEQMTFEGFLGHAGHSYKVQGDEAIAAIHYKSKAAMVQLKQYYRSRYPNLIASIGDTPTCSRMEAYEDIDEIRPGNFVFYDVTQWNIGSCVLDQIAVAMACPVVAKHEERSELVVYGGGVHLSKDRLATEDRGTIFGLIVKPNADNSWGTTEGSYVRSLSQEHGIIKATEQLFKEATIGSLLYILPIHSCMCANAMKAFYTLDGQKIAMLR